MCQLQHTHTEDQQYGCLMRVEVSSPAFRSPACVAALTYVWTGLWDKNAVERRWSGWSVCLFTCTLFGSSPIQSTQSLSFVSLLCCQGSLVHPSDVTVLKEGGPPVSASTIQSPRPRALHPALSSVVRAWKCVVTGPLNHPLNSHLPEKVFSTFILNSLTLQT